MRGLRSTTKIPTAIGFALLLLLAWWAEPTTTAQPGADIQVNEAIPAEAPQETFDLEVEIKGKNFPTDPAVDFFVTGTTNPGGVTVQSVQRRNPRSLIARIDIDSEATLDDFDIQVRSLGAGRLGKGTELFRVLQKEPGGNGNQEAPGAVIDLAVIDVGFNWVDVTWTETADDGYDLTSGPADVYLFRYRLDGPLTDANFATSSGILNSGYWAESPGALQSFRLVGFEPDTTFNIAVVAEDDGDNVSSVSNNVVVTTDSFPAGNWVRETLNECFPNQGVHGDPGDDSDIAYTGQGNPLVTYQSIWCNGPEEETRLAEWSFGGFTTEVTGFEGGRALAIDPVTQEPTLLGETSRGELVFYQRAGTSWTGETVERRQASSDALVYSPAGDAAIAYSKESKNQFECILAERNGEQWTAETLGVVERCNRPRLAFDGGGNPAVAYMDTNGVDEANFNMAKPAFAYRSGGDWVHEEVELLAPDYRASSIGFAFDPASSTFVLSYIRAPVIAAKSNEPWLVRLCRRGPTSWSCETVEDSPSTALHTDLAVDTEGTVHLVYGNKGLVQHASRELGASTWSIEPVDWGWNGQFVSVGLAPSLAGGASEVGVTYGFRRDGGSVRAFGIARKPLP